MRALHLNLENFRNFPDVSVPLGEPDIFLLGRNGQGKSNLLEAIHCFHALRSFRTARTANLVRNGQSQARLYAEFGSEGQTPRKGFLRLPREGPKEAEIDGRRVESLADWLGSFPSTVLCSDDIQVIRSAPSGRRRLFDLHLAATRPGYVGTLRRYHEGLRERNRLLKDQAGPDLIASFTSPLVPLVRELVSVRTAAIADLAPRFRSIHESIAGPADTPDLRYSPNIRAEEEDGVRAVFRDGLERDRVLGSTQRGPHRDDFDFLLGDRSSREFASDGQQRTHALALRLALHEELKAAVGFPPLILADDVIGDLDSERRARFWAGLPRDSQLIATGTTVPDPPPSGRWKVIRVENAGVFEPDHA